MSIKRSHVTFCVGNSNVCPVCHCLRDNFTFELPNVFDSTLKVKVKDVDSLNENWQAMVPCKHAYACKKWRL